MAHRPTTQRNDSNDARLRRAIARFLAYVANEARLRRAIAGFLAELRVLPAEPALIPIPESRARTRKPR